jgi:AraC-like DNA-binding protein
MFDPLTAIVSVLQPAMIYAKIVTGAGRWGVRGSFVDAPLCCCLVLEGRMRYTVNDTELTVEAGDFVLIPAILAFTATSEEPPLAHEWQTGPTLLENGEYRNGRLAGSADLKMLIGFCRLAAPDSPLLLTLLPKLVHVRGDHRLSLLVQLVVDEARVQRPARDIVLKGLLDVMLTEALRSSCNTVPSQGLVRGLTDPRLANALRRLHEAPEAPWTVALLAREAALSRSMFFGRFSAIMGITPMEYVLAWRMTLARRYLQQKKKIADVATLVGYSSASTFTVAFTRHTGMAPGYYARTSTNDVVAAFAQGHA